jgi:predicted nuclease of predicted toxin-antitoxin system
MEASPRFLVDADLPRMTSIVLTEVGVPAIDVRDIGLRHADDAVIAAYARTNGLPILTADMDFADIRNYPPDQHHGIVVLRIGPMDTRESILALVRSFFTQLHLLAHVPGRLVVVEPERARFRPPIPG